MAITFTVNLSTVNDLSSKQPYTSSEGTNFSETRSTWFPTNILCNRVLKHGDTITVSGLAAVYLRSNYTSGTYKFLDVTSGTA